MLIFISCAKTMASECKISVPELTVPFFENEAEANVAELINYDTKDLEKLLKINSSLAAENKMRYYEFMSPDNKPMPAICAYTGAVFKKLDAASFSGEDLLYSQDHLLISSFLYGVLRPLDGIRPYRLEGNVRLQRNDEKSMFDHWKPLLTDLFIERIKRQGGVLVNLASSEMQSLFDWKKVVSQVRVISPEFQVIKDGKLKTIVMYAKMCRGEMTRYLIKNRIADPDDIRRFEFDGFVYDESLSTPDKPVFVLSTI